MFEFIAENNPTKGRIEQRFSHDAERDVAAVLNDLVRSGLVYATGSGDATVYGATPGSVRNAVQRQNDKDSLGNLVWLLVFRGEAATQAQVAGLLALDENATAKIVDELVASGRLRRQGDLLLSSNLVLPLGAEQGWEVAILDHFRAVAVAIANKVRGGFSPSTQSDAIGGSTYTFTVTKDHPYAEEVYALLRNTRVQAQALWERVAAHNEAHPPDENEQVRVSFYAGQSVEPRAEMEESR